MKQLNIFQSEINDKIIAITASIILFFIGYPVYVNGLNKAKEALEGMRDSLLKNIIPAAATIILVCLAIGYAGQFIEKNTFIRWAIGVIIAGSATQITALFISINP